MKVLAWRTGAVWASFTLFHLIALLKWHRQPYWLPLVAGVRLTEVFSDWVYLSMAESITWFGKVGLFIASSSPRLQSFSSNSTTSPTSVLGRDLSEVL